MEKKRLNIVVYGRVQGVGFRFFAQDVACDLELTGWVRNRPDGNVEVEVQGEKENCDLFCSRLREGPSLSHVTNLTITSMPFVDKEDVFVITH
jgi:acylphosphatase